MNAMTHASPSSIALLPPLAGDVRTALKTSLYPGASDASVDMVLAYCKAAQLDPMTKPVHLVPMWDRKSGSMRDVVMPGIGLYRTIAARSGCAGISEPDFGPDVTTNIGKADITYPLWCRVTVRRLLPSGDIVDFTAKELWIENYAVKGGKEKSIEPNAMWSKRPYGQIAKCAEAQALRKAFPEVGAQPTAEEMEGKVIEVEVAQPARAAVIEMPKAKVAEIVEAEIADMGQHSVEDAVPAPRLADLGPITDLSPSQCRLIRAKAAAAGYADDTALLAAYPELSKATINDVLKALSA